MRACEEENRAAPVSIVDRRILTRHLYGQMELSLLGQERTSQLRSDDLFIYNQHRRSTAMSVIATAKTSKVPYSFALYLKLACSPSKRGQGHVGISGLGEVVGG